MSMPYMPYRSTPSALPKPNPTKVQTDSSSFAGDMIKGAVGGSGLGPWGAVAGAGLGLLSGILGSKSIPDYDREDFDYDPDDTAKKRYKELTDENSTYNKGLLGKYMRIAGNSTPGKDTLMAPIRAAGGGYMGSAAIAAQQAKGLSEKGRNDAFEGWTSAVIGNEGNASRYLGLDYQKEQYGNEAWNKSRQRSDENDADIWGSAADVGGTLLGMFKF